MQDSAFNSQEMWSDFRNWKGLAGTHNARYSHAIWVTEMISVNTTSTDINSTAEIVLDYW